MKKLSLFALSALFAGTFAIAADMGAAKDDMGVKNGISASMDGVKNDMGSVKQKKSARRNMPNEFKDGRDRDRSRDRM